MLFDGDAEPRKHHVVQVWRTPFITADVSEAKAAQTFLSKIGNAEIVRAMAECAACSRCWPRMTPSAACMSSWRGTAATSPTATSGWASDEAHDLKSALVEIKTTAEAALGEFEKVRRMRKTAPDQTTALQRRRRKPSTPPRTPIRMTSSALCS
jgi:hypothetical protein